MDTVEVPPQFQVVIPRRAKEFSPGREPWERRPSPTRQLTGPPSPARAGEGRGRGTGIRNPSPPCRTVG
jgi:hypothetical protein